MRWFRRKPQRPVGLHDDSPWPPPDEWAKSKIEEILRGGVLQQAWTDETCGDLCVVSFHPGGEAAHRKVNPACTKHRRLNAQEAEDARQRVIQCEVDRAIGIAEELIRNLKMSTPWFNPVEDLDMALPALRSCQQSLRRVKADE